MMCSGCGLEEDRDVIAAPQVPGGCGGFFRSPRRPSHERRREGMKVNMLGQNGCFRAEFAF